MLVDDEPDIRTVAEMSLSHVGGWNTLVASNGAQALTMAAEHRPDVIVLDVMMPEMDGVATFHALSEQPETRDIPIIFMTAKIQPQERERYMKFGAAGVIAKPFDPMGLPKEIMRILAEPKSGVALSSDAAPGAPGDRMSGLRQRYALKLAGKLEGLVGVLETAREADDDEHGATIEAAQRVAHTLLGTAGTYGHHEFSEAMAIIEGACRALVQAPADQRAQHWVKIDAALIVAATLTD